jgi:mono/diheme cytochrome c family protein
MKNKISKTLPVLCAIGFLATGCASNNTLAKRQADLPKEQVDAPGLFVENCATCHGKDGRAKTFHGRLVGAQNLTEWEWQPTDDDILQAIRTGPSLMPAFGKKLSPAEIDALAGYVRTFRAKNETE